MSDFPRRNGLCSVPIFLYRKISHTRRRSSFFAKRHARFAYSLASALSDGSLSLPPFCESACGANYVLFQNALCRWYLVRKRRVNRNRRAQASCRRLERAHVGTDFAPFRFFFAEKSVTRAVVPPFSQKGTLGSPIRLQARSLTAHCRYHLFARAPAAQIIFMVRLSHLVFNSSAPMPYLNYIIPKHPLSRVSRPQTPRQSKPPRAGFLPPT